jgi:putative ABC transport system permease protein
VTHLFVLAARSAWNRRLTLFLTLAAIALSVALLLGVDRIRRDARESFAQAVSGTDLVVGARTSPVQLMLYAVFRIGGATHNMKFESYKAIAAHPMVKWAIPISLGDSHRGFPVVGTNGAYFEHFRYGGGEPLSFASGKPFADIFETVVGADVAERLGYRAGEKITLSHGSGELGAEHGDKPFTVVGVLARTGTPVEHVRKFDVAPKDITAALVGLKSRAAVFRMQRFVNDHKDDALVAVLPGVALDELWQVVGVAERVLLAVSAMVVAVGLAGLVAVVLAGLNERRRELAILRSVGARPRDVFVLLMLEALGITIAGAIAGVALLGVLTFALAPFAAARYGLIIGPTFIAGGEWVLLGAVVAVGVLASLVPAYRAYRLSLADGLTPRI